MKRTDLVGARFGRLTVLEDSGRRNRGNVYWRVECKCGTIKEVLGYVMASGAVKSCGCLHREVAKTMGLKRSRPRARKGKAYSVSLADFDELDIG